MYINYKYIDITQSFEANNIHSILSQKTTKRRKFISIQIIANTERLKLCNIIL